MAKKLNVYEALQIRIKKIFDFFDYAYVAFSGGKDSGVLLCACIDFMRKNYPNKKLGVFHLDYEIQYSCTVDYINRILEDNKDILEVYRVCVPIKVPTSTSMFQTFWRPWDPEMKDLWVRELPPNAYVKDDFDFYKEEMWDYELNSAFAAWLRKTKGCKKICCMVGIRTQESYNRWRMIYVSKGLVAKGRAVWLKFIGSGVYNAYPLYDWLTTDVWTANGKFGWDYNELYNLYYKAGIPIERQRVASPFILPGQQYLKLYRAIDPNMWGKMLCRVNGVNFTGIYGGTHAMGWHHLKLPEGMTWKRYMYFLLDTLPEPTRERYLDRLKVSIEFWRKKGGCLDSKTIEGLMELGVPIDVGYSSSYRTIKLPVRMEYQDDINLPAFKDLPTYKRVCVCILKNDHYCKYMGFSPTKIERDKKQKIQKAFTNFYTNALNNPFLD